jgi:hypothetical protein
MATHLAHESAAHVESLDAKPRRREKRPELARYVPKARLPASSADAAQHDLRQNVPDPRNNAYRPLESDSIASKPPSGPVGASQSSGSSRDFHRGSRKSHDAQKGPTSDPSSRDGRSSACSNSGRGVRSRTNSVTSTTSERSENGRNRTRKSINKRASPSGPPRPSSDATICEGLQKVKLVDSLISHPEDDRLLSKSLVFEKRPGVQDGGSTKDAGKPRIPSLLEKDFPPPPTFGESMDSASNVITDGATTPTRVAEEESVPCVPEVKAAFMDEYVNNFFIYPFFAHCESVLYACFVFCSAFHT